MFSYGAKSCINLRIPHLEHFSDLLHAFMEPSHCSIGPSFIYLSYYIGNFWLIGICDYSRMCSATPCFVLNLCLNSHDCMEKRCFALSEVFSTSGFTTYRNTHFLCFLTNERKPDMIISASRHRDEFSS